jgi:putative transposase
LKIIAFEFGFCLIAHKIRNYDVIALLFQLFILHGILKYICPDNGPEFTAKAVRKWLNWLGVKTLFIERGSPWENGYIESFMANYMMNSWTGSP